MGGPHIKTRRHSKVSDELPAEIRSEVDRFLIQGATYPDISEFLKTKGYDISKSSIGRYGKEFLSAYQRLRIIEDQSRTLKSEAGDGLNLEETASKMFTGQILELLVNNNIDVRNIPRLVSDFAKLQASSVLRERNKLDFMKKSSAFFIDFMKDLINYLTKNDPEAVQYIERNFDEFIAFAKEKYAAQ